MSETLTRGVNVRHLVSRRATMPGSIAAGWAARRRRPLLADDGRSLIIAADHPARGALGVRDNPMCMANRADLLERLATALSRPGVDGVLGTADILEDLLMMGLLDDMAVVGSMNRGGLQGATFEFDDRFTGYCARDIDEFGLEAGKLLVRVALDDPGTVPTLVSAAQAVTELAQRRRIALVEPFWSGRTDDGTVVNLLDADSVIRSIQVASGLGATSAYTWLKLPVVPDIGRVLDATTLPTLLLGGDPTGRPEEIYASWEAALTHPCARGLVVGRALLYPAEGDVASAVDIAAALVHGGQQ